MNIPGKYRTRIDNPAQGIVCMYCVEDSDLLPITGDLHLSCDRHHDGHEVPISREQWEEDRSYNCVDPKDYPEYWGTTGEARD